MEMELYIIILALITIGSFSEACKVRVSVNNGPLNDEHVYVVNVNEGDNVYASCNDCNNSYVTYLMNTDHTTYQQSLLEPYNYNNTVNDSMSFMCCQHTGNWLCSRSIYINVTHNSTESNNCNNTIIAPTQTSSTETIVSTVTITEHQTTTETSALTTTMTTTLLVTPTSTATSLLDQTVSPQFRECVQGNKGFTVFIAVTVVSLIFTIVVCVIVLILCKCYYKRKLDNNV